MSTLVSKAEDFAINILDSNSSPNYLYHNLRHTQRVVESTKELIDGEKVDEKKAEQLLVAAWFHDLGYTVSYSDHEKRSCDFARDFLTENNCSKTFIDNVCNLIMATVEAYEPKNKLEEIIRDADSSHFAFKNFIEISELLREELASLGLQKYAVADWRAKNIHLLRTKHRFYTTYALNNWQKRKDKNIKKLIKAKKKNNKLIKKRESQGQI